jgi:hypothetical protein
MCGALANCAHATPSIKKSCKSVKKKEDINPQKEKLLMSNDIAVHSVDQIAARSFYSDQPGAQFVCERYVTRERLAAIMDVSIRTIDRLVVLGMPSETWGIKARRFLPSQALAWAAEHEDRSR